MLTAKRARDKSNDFHTEKTKTATDRLIKIIENNIDYSLKRGAKSALVPIPLHADKVAAMRVFQVEGYKTSLAGNASDLVKVEWT